MDYKYQRRQIFGKRLKVPKHILNKVYNCTLYFNEFIEYQLDDKIPTSCIIESDRRIVEKFGIDRCKELDWELINKRIYYNNISFKDILMSIDSQTEDINHSLYELVKNQIKPSDYSPKMSEIYSDRLFEIPKIENYDTYDYIESRIRNLKSNFNNGEVSLKEIISNWELFKDKDLSYCLLNDENNKNNITDSSLKSYNKVGLFVGMNKQKQAKVYLQEPIVNGRTTVSCVAVGVDKICRVVLTEEDEQKARLDFLYRRRKELSEEIAAIDKEVYKIELQLMGRG